MTAQVIYVTNDELRESVLEILKKYNLTIEEFLATDRDEFDSLELQDLSLFVKNKLK